MVMKFASPKPPLTIESIKGNLSSFLHPILICPDGATSLGVPTENKHHQEETLELAYKQVIERVEPGIHLVATQHEELRNLVVYLVNVALQAGSRKTRHRATKLLNGICDQWVVLIIDVDNIFAFKRDSKRNTRCRIIKAITKVAMRLSRDAAALTIPDEDSESS